MSKPRTAYANQPIVLGAVPGDVFGPASATDNEAALFDGATGKLLKGSGFTAGSTSATSLHIGNGATATGTNSVAIGRTATTGAGAFSVAIGDGASTVRGDAIAIGVGASVPAGTTVQFGGIAIGSGASSINENAVAVGESAQADLANSCAFGPGANALAEDSVAVGATPICEAAATRGVAIGHNAYVPSVDGIAIGDTATVSGGGSVSIGAQSDAAANCVAVGPGSQAIFARTVCVGDTAITTGADAVSIGWSTNTAGSCTAVGRNAAANAASSTCLGFNSKSDGTGGIAIGHTAESAATDMIAIGRNAGVGATAAHTNSIALGNGALPTAANQFCVSNMTVAGGSAVAGDPSSWWSVRLNAADYYLPLHNTTAVHTREYGSIYVADGSGAATTLTLQGSYYELTDSTFTAGSELDSFDMVVNGQLRYTGSATKVFWVTGQIAFTSSAAADNIICRLGTNGTSIAETSMVRRSSGAILVTMDCTGLLRLENNQYVSMFASDDSNPGQTITPRFINLTAHAVALA